MAYSDLVSSWLWVFLGSNFLLISSLINHYLEMCQFLNIWEFSRNLCVTYVWFISITVREHSLYDLNCLKLIENRYCQKVIYIGKWSVYTGLPHFILLSFIALCRNCISFLQVEGLWQFCLKQVYWHQFSKSVYSLCVSVSYVGNSHSIFHYYCMVICDQWS